MDTNTATEKSVGELAFEETIHLTGITEYGINFNELATGQVAPPKEGATFDIAYEGEVTGEKLSGTIKGTDYLQVRADGRTTIHVHATITTTDGEKIAVIETGFLMPPSDGSSSAELRATLSFRTGSAKYAWLNLREARGNGQVDMASGQGRIQAWMA